MRALIVDPSAYSVPYDAALCAALARAGVDVELATSAFAHGERPAADGYVVSERFYRRARGDAGSRRRRAVKLASHVDDMRGLARVPVDVRHFQWTPVPWVDAALLGPRPRVLTVHNAAPRSPRFGRERAVRAVIDRMDGLIVHSRFGAEGLREQGVPGERIHAIPHGAFTPGPPSALPPEIIDDGSPVVLMFGLLRPYKGLSTLLEAWRGIDGAQLWIAGRAMMELPRLPRGVSLASRYIADGEASALLRRADVVVLPYEADGRIDGSGALMAALGAGRATVVSAVGGLAEVARTGAAMPVSAGDAAALHAALAGLIADPVARARLAARARAAADGPYSWDSVAAQTRAVYASLR